ncbi:syntaxin-binding protein 1-like isoform X2 [Zophobas morio]|uniref:syntaxin-binding protein 1-like isoform X2 n=1 Tax=Zophobas morio TaxID=2755281 RepID=UPI003083D9FF
MSALKSQTYKRLVNEVFKKVKDSEAKAWRILVVDSVSTKVIASALRINDLTEHGITVVEKLELSRRPFPNFEAVYIISATESSVDLFINDYKDSSKAPYKAAYLFTLTPLNTELFEKVSKSNASAFLKCLTELNLDFLALEEQIFGFYNDLGTWERFSEAEPDILHMARQLATLCVTLQEDVYVGYWKHGRYCKSLAQKCYALLGQYVDEANLARKNADKGQLIIVDRAQDVLTLVLHDCHYQPMIYDLLQVDNDVYKYESNGRCKEVVIGMEDALWLQLRHLHIAETIQTVGGKIRENRATSRTKNLKKEKVSIQELQDAMKAMPEHQRELTKQAFHLHTTEKCMDEYNRQNLEALTKAEQDLAVGEDSTGLKINTKDLMPLITQILSDQNASEENKVRIIMAYVIIKQGISKKDLEKLYNMAQLSNEHRTAINNLSLLDVKVLSENETNWQPIKRIKRDRSGWYADSRWVPVLRDIMEYCLNGQYEAADILFVEEKPPTQASKSSDAYNTGASSQRSRTPVWAEKKLKNESEDKFRGPTLIIFVIGGISRSEMRHVYELSSMKNRLILLGSTNVLKPSQLIKTLKMIKESEVTPKSLGY